MVISKYRSYAVWLLFEELHTENNTNIVFFFFYIMASFHFKFFERTKKKKKFHLNRFFVFKKLSTTFFLFRKLKTMPYTLYWKYLTLEEHKSLCWLTELWKAKTFWMNLVRLLFKVPHLLERKRKKWKWNKHAIMGEALIHVQALLHVVCLSKIDGIFAY